MNIVNKGDQLLFIRFKKGKFLDEGKRCGVPIHAVLSPGDLTLPLPDKTLCGKGYQKPIEDQIGIILLQWGNGGLPLNYSILCLHCKKRMIELNFNVEPTEEEIRSYRDDWAIR